MDRSTKIAITCFIDPHNFFFTEYGVDHTERNQLEERLDTLSKTHSLKHVKAPFHTRYVVLKYIPYNRLIRGELLTAFNIHQRNSDKILVWAMDYGFPIMTSQQYLWEMPESLTIPLNLIKWGGVVDVLPANKEYDFITQSSYMKKSAKWNEKICEALSQSLEGSSLIFFQEKYNLAGHYWGELYIMREMGKNVSISEGLIDSNYAIKPNQSFKDEILREGYKDFFTIIKNTTVLKFKENLFGLDEESPSKMGPHFKYDEWQRRNQISNSENSLLDCRSELEPETYHKTKSFNEGNRRLDVKSSLKIPCKIIDDSCSNFSEGLSQEALLVMDRNSTFTKASSNEFSSIRLEKSLSTNEQMKKNHRNENNKNVRVAKLKEFVCGNFDNVDKPIRSEEKKKAFNKIKPDVSQNQQQIDVIRELYFQKKENSSRAVKTKRNLYPEDSQYVPAEYDPDDPLHYSEASHFYDLEFMSARQNLINKPPEVFEENEDVVSDDDDFSDSIWSDKEKNPSQRSVIPVTEDSEKTCYLSSQTRCNEKFYGRENHNSSDDSNNSDLPSNNCNDRRFTRNEKSNWQKNNHEKLFEHENINFFDETRMVSHNDTNDKSLSFTKREKSKFSTSDSNWKNNDKVFREEKNNPFNMNEMDSYNDTNDKRTDKLNSSTYPSNWKKNNHEKVFEQEKKNSFDEKRMFPNDKRLSFTRSEKSSSSTTQSPNQTKDANNQIFNRSPIYESQISKRNNDKDVSRKENNSNNDNIIDFPLIDFEDDVVETFFHRNKIFLNVAVDKCLSSLSIESKRNKSALLSDENILKEEEPFIQTEKVSNKTKSKEKSFKEQTENAGDFFQNDKQHSKRNSENILPSDSFTNFEKRTDLPRKSISENSKIPSFGNKEGILKDANDTDPVDNLPVDLSKKNFSTNFSDVCREDL